MRTAVTLSNQTTQLTVPAKSAQLKRIRQTLLNATRTTPLSPEDVEDLLLAVTEAVTNSIRHAQCDHLAIALNVDVDGITVKVIDRGCGFKFSRAKFKFPALEETGGRGLPLMRNLVDVLNVNSRPGSGTEVTLVKKFETCSRSAS